MIEFSDVIKLQNFSFALCFSKIVITIQFNQLLFNFFHGKMNYTTFLQSQSSSNEDLRLLPFPFVSLVLISLYVFVIVKLFIKHRHHLEPVHIYELSILSDFLVIFTTVFLENFECIYQSQIWAPYCVVVNFVRLSARLSVFTDISASQVDRFYIRYNITISGIPGGQVSVPLLEPRV